MIGKPAGVAYHFQAPANEVLAVTKAVSQRQNNREADQKPAKGGRPLAHVMLLLLRKVKRDPQA